MSIKYAEAVSRIRRIEQKLVPLIAQYRDACRQVSCLNLAISELYKEKDVLEREIVPITKCASKREPKRRSKKDRCILTDEEIARMVATMPSGAKEYLLSLLSK